MIPYKAVFIRILQQRHRIGVAIGDYILDLTQVKEFFNGPILSSCQNVFDEVGTGHRAGYTYMRILT